MKRHHKPMNETMGRYRLRHTIGAISAIPLLCAMTDTARAVDDIYTNPAGTLWGTPTNWSDGFLPTTGDRAFLNGIGNYTITLNTDYTNFPLLFLVLDAGNAPLNATTLAQTNPAANMVAATEWVGDGGSATATYLQTTATNTDTGDLFIGHTLSTTVGKYNLQGGALTVAGNEYVGFNGKGAFNQTGGTHTIGSTSANKNLYLGFNLGSNGTTTLNNPAAQLTVNGSAYIGGSDTAAKGFGLLNIQSGTMTIANTLKVWNGTGNVFLSGGTLILNGPLDTSGNPSNFQWTGGTLNINNLDIFNIDSMSGPLGNSISIDSSKSLVVRSNEIVGNAGNGTITQTGGTNTTGQSGLDIGVGIGSSGSYTLSGSGNISASHEEIGLFGAATFIQTGGTNSTNALQIAIGSIASGTYTISGGTTIVTGNVDLGGDDSTAGGGDSAGGGSDLLAIQNGAFTVAGILKIWNARSSSLILSGGTLSVGSLDFDGNPARFIWTGGTLNVTNSDLIFDSAATAPFATLILKSGQTLNVIDNETIANGGTASLTMNSGSVHSVGGTVTLNTGGILTLLPGSSFSYSLFIHNGGTINGSFINTGNFIQFGGSFSGTFTNDGAISLNGSSITGAATVTNNSDGTIIGPGFINAPFANAGTLNVPSGVTKAGSFVNSGLIEMSSPSAQLGPVGIITNNAIIEGFGKISDDILNNGTIQSIGGTLNISGALTNLSGLLAAPAGTNLLISSGLSINGGIISLTGGTFDNNNHPLTNTGQITGYGVLRTGGAGGLTNNGSITFTGGTSTINGPVTNSSGKTLLIKNDPALFTGPVTNNGTINVTGTTITYTGTYSGNKYISDPSTNIFQNSVTVTTDGSMTGGASDQFIFAGPFTNNGNFTNAGTLQVTASITNTAAFSQSGPQSWLPGATVTNTSGNSTFQSNAKLYGLTISAGTVDITSSKFIIEPANKSATLAALQSNIVFHSLIATGMPANFALALLDNALLNKPTFGGNPADANSILLSEELLGDANADGTVDLTDLSTLLNNFGATTANWTSGNFDNAPTIDLTDLSDVLNNFGAVNTNPNASALPSPSPEPTTLALTAPLLAILARRRSKNPL